MFTRCGARAPVSETLAEALALLGRHLPPALLPPLTPCGGGSESAPRSGARARRTGSGRARAARVPARIGSARKTEQRGQEPVPAAPARSSPPRATNTAMPMSAIGAIHHHFRLMSSSSSVRRVVVQVAQPLAQPLDRVVLARQHGASRSRRSRRRSASCSSLPARARRTRSTAPGQLVDRRLERVEAAIPAAWRASGPASGEGSSSSHGIFRAALRTGVVQTHGPSLPE